MATPVVGVFPKRAVSVPTVAAYGGLGKSRTPVYVFDFVRPLLRYTLTLNAESRYVNSLFQSLIR